MDMIKKITRFITSMPFMGILLLILAAAIAVATFIENAYGPVAAQGTIYQAWWFELAILLVSVNLAYNIFKYKLYTLKKLPLFLFHLAFLVIIAGAALTRFTGEEGMMGIREGDIRDLYKSDDTFFYIRVVSQGDTVEKYQKIYLSSINKKQVRLKFRFGEDIIRVRSVDYISGNRMKMNGQMGAMGRHPDVLHLKIGINNGEEDLMIRGLPKSLIMANESDIAGLHLTTGFGVRKHRLPFALELKNFQLDRYPGSMSPSSFASEVVLIDEAHDITRPFRIYMNNILKYRGYRFYQSSYDSDEKGTVLSVNHDPLGIRVTYFGYFLMMICIILALFTPGSRFKRLLKITGKKATFTAVLMIGLLVSQSIHAQSTAVKVDVKEAKAFGRIWVQGSEGRFKPANSMAMEIIRKLTGNNRYRGYSPEQFWLGLMISTDYWQNEKLFKLDRPQLRKMIGVSSDKASFNDFFKDNSYLLGGMMATAQRKNPNQRNPLDKALLKLDEKLNVFYMALNGAYLKVFPDPTDLDARWLAPTDRPVGFPSEDSLFIVSGFGQYLQALNSDSLDIAASLRQYLSDYQTKYAGDILPDARKASFEILYDKFLIFERLTLIYAIIGLLFLVIQFLAMYRPKKWQRKTGNVFTILIGVAFIVHTIGLALRWYLSGHAPMSNGYESMIFVAWGTILAGLLLAKRSRMSIALTVVLAALALLVAHMSWMNPEITPLIPVLKSVWLTIHVAVIMTSYSFLGLGALIGLVAMVLYATKTKRNNTLIENHIQHLTRLNKIVLIVGLYLITIGCFLGAIWANEAWGRYWGWDPKETWCLITILIYVFIVHMNHIKGFNNTYSFNVGSLIGFGSVLMTYFGVNYFLGGMHSYAGGDIARMPVFAYVLIIILVLLAYVAYFNNLRFKEEPNNE